MGIKVIVTGATGMVGEGVLLECLAHPQVEAVLMVNRRHFELVHPKLTECLVEDFMKLDGVEDRLVGYDACLFCAGISSAGMKEANYTHITYDVTLHFAQALARLNPAMVFEYVSGASTDSSEQGRSMWARVKGRTENALTRVGFAKVYLLRPGGLKPSAGQRNVEWYYALIGAAYPLLNALFPKYVSTVRELGLAMIAAALVGYPKQILEVPDIRALAKG